MDTEQTSQALFARSLKVAPGGVHSPVRAFRGVGGTPVFMARGDGAYLYSVEGKRYVDFCQSFGPNILGHRDPDVSRALREQIELGWCFGACDPYSLELAELVTQSLPWVERLRFVCSGTEAVMSALRVARAATNRPLILKFEGCYHGHADQMLVKAGSGLAGEAASDSAGVPAELAAMTLVAPLDDEAALEQVFEQHGSRIAAVILEPMPANYGLLEPRREWIERVMSLARENGSLVIFDEVISGFRVAFGGMAERLDMRPDLVTYGKVLGGGLAVGAFGGRRDLMDTVAPAGPVYQAGTLSANPLAMRTGLATLQKLRASKVHETLEARTKAFVKNLGPVLAKARMAITSVGSVFWIHPQTGGPIRSLKDLPAGMGETYKPFFHALLERGVYLAPSGYEVGFVSLAHTDDILNEAVETIRGAIGALG
jgi:glutamate-1-semialdehyde 2,1-aminomutase